MLLYNGGMIHAKAIVVDDRVALFGSPNFDLRSLFVNFEVGVLVYTEPRDRRDPGVDRRRDDPVHAPR